MAAVCFNKGDGEGEEPVLGSGRDLCASSPILQYFKCAKSEACLKSVSK